MDTRRRLLAASFLIGAWSDQSLATEPTAFDNFRLSPNFTFSAGPALAGTRQFPETSDVFTLGSNGVVTRTRGLDGATTDTVHFSSPAVMTNASVSLSSGASGALSTQTNMVRPEPDRPQSTRCGASPNTPEEIVQLVENAALRHGVDADLARAIAWAESRYDRVRNSPKGARGPMQLMPATAARFGVSDPCDPTANIEAGVRYLRILLERFTNPLLAVAAYNAGEQAIADHDGVPPYRETVRYIATVLNRQMHLDLARERGGRQSDSVATALPPAASTVIGTRPVTFVGGVLNF